MINDLVPQLVSENKRGLVAMVYLEGGRCPTCNTPMFPEFRGYGVAGISLNEQIKRAGWRTKSAALDAENRQLCTVCAEQGRATFVCALCGNTRPSDQIERTFGDAAPPDANGEFLCKPCYGSMSAAQWDKTVEHLERKHRWDFE